MDEENSDPAIQEKGIVNFKHNGVYFWFGNRGISAIWGYGSYTDKGRTLTKANLHDVFTNSNTVELYNLGTWEREITAEVMKHFSLDREGDWPISDVSIKDYIWVLNLLQERESIPSPQGRSEEV